MLVYLVIGISLLFLAYKYDYKGCVKNKKIWERIILSFMIAVVGLRYHIGSDTVVYEWNFNTSYTPNLNYFIKEWNGEGQPLWNFVMSFCKTYFQSFVAVQFFHAIIYNIFLMRFIKKVTCWHFTALFIAFSQIWFTNSFEVLRESISAVIYMNALLFLNEKKYVIYITLGILATGFHMFAFIIFFITLIIVKLNYIFLFIFFVLIFIGVKIVDFSSVNKLLLAFSVLMSDSVSDKMELYIGKEDTTVISILGLFRYLFLDLLLPLLILKSTDSTKIFYKKLIVLWMIFSCMTSELPILYRMGNYLSIIYIVFLVNMLYEHKKLSRRMHLISIWLTIGMVLMNFRDIYRPSSMEYRSNIHYDCRYFPYKTIFQDPDPIREGLVYY